MSFINAGPKVVKYKNLPARLPVWPTIVLWLLLDRLRAPGWVWGVCGTITALGWLGSLAQLLYQKETDIFKEDQK